MVNLDVDLNEQAQKAVTEIYYYCEVEVHVSVAAVICEYGVHKN